MTDFPACPVLSAFEHGDEAAHQVRSLGLRGLFHIIDTYMEIKEIQYKSPHHAVHHFIIESVIRFLHPLLHDIEVFLATVEFVIREMHYGIL